jgi:hypothetical protein
LVVTKLADLWTTIRHVGPEAESNPLARRWFKKFGFRGGLAMVMGVWLLIVGLVFVQAWNAPLWLQVPTLIMSFFVAWVQWEVARFNAKGKPNHTIRAAMRIYQRWGNLMR